MTQLVSCFVFFSLPVQSGKKGRKGGEANKNEFLDMDGAEEGGTEGDKEEFGEEEGDEKVSTSEKLTLKHWIF